MRKPCLLAKVVEKGAANRAMDGVALMPKTAGVLVAVAVRRDTDLGAERANDRNESMARYVRRWNGKSRWEN
jgi:hypothetical protein